jgi:hypothetical protein
LCEEFHCLPSEAVRELAIAPDGLLWEIVELRAYADAKWSVDEKDRPANAPRLPTAMESLVREIEKELAQEEISGRATG